MKSRICWWNAVQILKHLHYVIWLQSESQCLIHTCWFSIVFRSLPLATCYDLSGVCLFVGVVWLNLNCCGSENEIMFASPLEEYENVLWVYGCTVSGQWLAITPDFIRFHLIVSAIIFGLPFPFQEKSWLSQLPWLHALRSCLFQPWTEHEANSDWKTLPATMSWFFSLTLEKSRSQVCCISDANRQSCSFWAQRPTGRAMWPRNSVAAK